MKQSIPYTYVVAQRRRRTRDRWSLAVLTPGGFAKTLAHYTSRAQAVSAARILTCDAGQFEVRT